jgi:transcriptional regulator with XRE-family HTH domain
MPKKRVVKLPPIDLGKETIGRRLAHYRKEKGLTQVQLAKKIGTIQAIISAYEKDKLQLSSEMVARFAKAIGVSCDEIIGYKSDGKEHPHISLKFVKRIKRLEVLPLKKQKIILRLLDSLLRDAEAKEK